jgi:hypothetical protein
VRLVHRAGGLMRMIALMRGVMHLIKIRFCWKSRVAE